MGFKIKDEQIQEASQNPEELVDEEEKADIASFMQNKHFIFKEWLIDSDPEPLSISKLYFR
jgi:hypothetical protein